MSIASEINRIKGNISSAYTGLQGKGASMPQVQNSSNLRATVDSISSGSAEKYTYRQLNDTVTAYLTAASYSPGDYSASVIENYCSAATAYRKDRPSGVTVTVPEAGVLTVYDGTGSMTYNVAAGSFVVSNITPGCAGSYVLRNQNGEIVAAGSLEPTGALRMINGDSNTFNIRDLGGWSCDGGTLKYGLIFRGCELNGDNYHVTLSNAQKKMFTDFLNIRDEIDLRGNSEVDGDDEIYGTSDDITESAFGGKVDYLRLPVASYANGVDLSNEVQTGYYAVLIKRIAADVREGRPCYIHCMAGADRTGTLCALIEALCGVSQSDIDKDYELTSFSSGNLRKRTDSVWTGFIDAIGAMSGSSFRDKVVNYALQAGVTIAEINELRAALIDGSPTVLTSPYANSSVTRTLTHVSSGNTENTTALYQPYESEITPDGGYVISGVQVTMGGTDITNAVFSGTKTNLLHAVSVALTDCTIDNHKDTVIDDESYAATVTPSAGYTLENAAVTITMGGTNVSNYYSDGKITIPRVTGNLVITITAQPQAAQNYFDSSTASDGCRIDSSGSAVSFNSGYVVSDFFEISPSDVLKINADVDQTANGNSGMVAYYTSNKTFIKKVGNANAFWAWSNSNKTGTYNLASDSSLSTVAYARVCFAYSDISELSINLE